MVADFGFFWLEVVACEWRRGPVVAVVAEFSEGHGGETVLHLGGVDEHEFFDFALVVGGFVVAGFVTTLYQIRSRP